MLLDCPRENIPIVRVAIQKAMKARLGWKRDGNIPMENRFLEDSLKDSKK
jgi:hypothetical protein